MKKLLGVLMALVLALSLVACGKENQEVKEIDSIRFNETVLQFPCKVQEMLNAVKGVETMEADLNAPVEPGATKFCSIFDYNNTSFGVMNMSAETATVKDCHVVMVSTSISLSGPLFSVVYPAGIEYGKEFDKEMVCEILGEPTHTKTTGMGEYFVFEQEVAGQGKYELSLTVLEDGTVGDVSLMMHPETEKTTVSVSTENNENDLDEETAGRESETIEIVQEETEPEDVKIIPEAMNNVYAESFRLRDVIYDESNLPKSNEELTISPELMTIELRTKGVKMSIPCNVQDFLNINSAANWDINQDTIPAKEVANYTLADRNSAVTLTVYNPTEKEIKATEGMLVTLAVDNAWQQANELNSFAFEFPGEVFVNKELDLDRTVAMLGEYQTKVDWPDRICYTWLNKGIAYEINVNKESNLVGSVRINRYEYTMEYVASVITEPTPYSYSWDTVNAVGVGVETIAEGTSQTKSFYVGASEVLIPCTVQEFMDQTGLVLSEKYTYYQVEPCKYMENIPLYNADGVKCLEIKAYCENTDYGRYVSKVTLFEVSQAVGENIPEEYLLKIE